jgi:hypothetical protein
VNVGVRLLPEKQLVNGLGAIGYTTNEEYKQNALLLFLVMVKHKHNLLGYLLN